MKKLKPYAGQPVKESIAIKIDGIQAMLNEQGAVVSRSGKPLYNLDAKLLKPGKKYEVYLGTFKETDSVLSTHESERKVFADEVYEIWPDTDWRLYIDPTCQVDNVFKWAVSMGYEGLVIDRKYKLKTEETHDVPITAVIPGKGKYLGCMGALMTPMGKVGTGFSDAMRKEDWNSRIGEFIEVECMQLTPDGKFRHPRFKRRRRDKSLDMDPTLG
jgi:hypothetical protein